MILGVVTTQLGSAIAKNLFSSLGPPGTVFLRVGFAALILLIVWRPGLGGYGRGDYLVAALFGLALAAMNFAFYSALDRIPLGVAVTLEFVGPLGVAVAGSRRLLDVVWAALAAAGILLLAPWGGTHLDSVGVVLALVAGCCWAAYILLSARVGMRFSGIAGLAIAMTCGATLLVPVGIIGAGSSLLQPAFLLTGLGVALLSSVIPYSLELEALRRLPTRVFGVLMSCEPAIAALLGFVILGEVLGVRAVTAIFCVTLATLGASRVRAPDTVE